VKINPINDPARFVNTVRERSDAGEGRGGNPQQQQRDKKEEQPEEVFQVTEDIVSNAVETFAVDAQATANGLNASMEGNGPGLRVVLKDGSGAIVRQFTGEEFLKLREAVSKEGRTRGKILDQKL